MKLTFYAEEDKMYSCACCGKIVAKGEKVAICSACGWLFCEECVEDGSYDAHDCSEMD